MREAKPAVQSKGTLHPPRHHSSMSSASSQASSGTRGPDGVEFGGATKGTRVRHPLSLAVSLGLSASGLLMTAHAQADFPAVVQADLSGSNGVTIIGDHRRIKAAGDVNGDGIGDFVLGARSAGENGEAYVIFGTDKGFPASIALADLNGSNGFKIIGSSVGLDDFGSAVAAAGDVNGDGIHDIVITDRDFRSRAPEDTERVGAAWVVFGRTSGFGAEVDVSTLDGTDGFLITRVDDSDNYLGRVVAGGFDFNDDGFDDILIGHENFGEDPQTFFSPGAGYVIFGADTMPATVDVAALGPSTGFTIENDVSTSENFAGSLGRGVAALSDFNGDGFNDIALKLGFDADRENDSQEGRVYVLFGRSQTPAEPFALTTLSGSDGVIIEGAAGDDLARDGRMQLAGGDINGDGLTDLIVTSKGAPAYVVFGRQDSPTEPIKVSTLATDGTGFAITGPGARVVDIAGDVNGDGIGDLLIGDAFGTNKGYVLFGREGTWDDVDLTALDGSNGFVIEPWSDVSESGFGRFTGALGDINGDGLGEVAFGSLGADRSFILLGGVTGPGLVPTATPSVDAIDFADVDVPATGEITFTVTNDGNTGLTFDTLTLTGPDAAAFVLSSDNCSNSTISAGDSCSVTVTVDPSIGGNLRGALELPSNAPGETLSLPLTRDVPPLSVPGLVGLPLYLLAGLLGLLGMRRLARGPSDRQPKMG